MQTGGLIGDFDVAQLMVILFFLFFVGLVLHLRQEDKREGYPLTDPAGSRYEHGGEQGFPPMPRPKTYRLMDGGATSAPHPEVERPLAARRVPDVPGSPYVATGDPLRDGLGPASYSMRKDTPLVYNYDKVQVLPLRSLPEWAVISDLDPRGMSVIAADGVQAGVVVDLWVDRSVKILRYLEIEVALGEASRRALLPIYYTDIKERKRLVKVSALRAAQFAQVPLTAQADTITAREEDRVNAFYAGADFFHKFPASRAVS
jgi:photosynthetic reaction center H subunit